MFTKTSEDDGSDLSFHLNRSRTNEVQPKEADRGSRCARGPFDIHNGVHAGPVDGAIAGCRKCVFEGDFVFQRRSGVGDLDCHRSRPDGREHFRVRRLQRGGRYLSEADTHQWHLHRGTDGAVNTGIKEILPVEAVEMPRCTNDDVGSLVIRF